MSTLEEHLTQLESFYKERDTHKFETMAWLFCRNHLPELVTLSTRLADSEKALREAQLEIANMEMTIRRAFDMLRDDKPIPVPVMDAMQKYAIRNMSPLR